MEILVHHPYVSLLQGAFMIWMLVDAYRRQVDFFWFYIILLVPVLGAWAYFFMFKVGDFGGLHLPTFLQRRTSMDELRFRVDQAPTMANHLALAQRLVEQHDYEAALPHFQAAGKTEPDHGQVLFGQARCHARLGQADVAVPLLQRLIEKDDRWSNYAAWHLLIETEAESGDRAASLASCRRLAQVAPTLQHKCLLAEHLLADGQAGEARSLLQHALTEYQYLPGPLRRRIRRWASVARRLLKQAG